MATLRVLYDFNCPYCFISHYTVDRLADAYGASVSWVPFELLPLLPGSGGTWDLHPAEFREFRNAVDLRARAFEVAIAIPPFRPNTARALRLAALAESYGLGPTVRHNLFEAYWLAGIDLGSVSRLMDVAEASGLPTKALDEQLDNVDLVDRVERAADEFRRSGYVAIPTFELDGLRVHGLREDLAAVAAMLELRA